MRPSEYEPPSFIRLMLLHASSEEWRDKPGFNAYFLRAIFPSLALEDAEDWLIEWRPLCQLPTAHQQKRGIFLSLFWLTEAQLTEEKPVVPGPSE